MRQVRELSAEQLQRGIPVQLRGVVTYCDRQLNLFFLEDSTGGIRIDHSADIGSFEPGQALEVSGIVGSGGDAPLIVQPQVRAIASARIPDAPVVSLLDMQSGRFDYRRVAVRGVVHDVTMDNRNLLAVDMVVGGVPVEGTVFTFSDNIPPFAGASILAKGVMSSARDSYGKSTDLRLWIPSLDDVAIERPAPALDKLPVRRVGDFTRMAGRAPPPEEIRIRGRCSRDEPALGAILSDGTGRIRIRPRGYSEELPEGDIDVAGFLKYESGVPVLDAAVLVKNQPADGKFRPVGSEVLSNITQIPRMPANQARYGYPVHVLATVTYADPVAHNLFVQNQTGGIYVLADGARTLARLRAGDAVEVDGVTIPGQFAASIGKAAVRVLGRGKMPEPSSVARESVFLGRADSQWVELDGVVQGQDTWSTHALVLLAWGTHTFRAHLVDLPALPASWYGARLRLRGVAGAVFNPHRQLIGFQMFVPGREYVTVLQPAPADLFTLPMRSINTLLQFSPDEDPGALVHVRGMVTLNHRSGPTWIRGVGGALTIRDHAPVELSPGDVVDVVGFPARGPFTPEIQHAVARKTGSGPPPVPIEITADEALDGLHDAELIGIDAILEEQVNGATETVLHLRSGRTSFEARVDNRPGMPTVAAGSLLRVTGICSVEVDSSHERVFARGFTLRMRSPSDVVVIRGAPWWTPDRTLRALGIAIGAGLLAFAWVIVLRRRVLHQTKDLRNARDAAEAANKAKSQFLTTMSHEIRTPMNGILGMTELVLDGELSEQQREDLEIARNSGQSLMSLLNDILDLSKIEAEKIEIESAPMDVYECVAEAMRVLQVRSREKHIDLVSRVDAAVPRFVKGDYTRIRQVLLNLVGNAIKFTEEGHVAVAVEMEGAAPEGDWILRFTVSDTGIGIPEEKQKLVFEAFQQADGSTARKYGGTGLGLAICSMLVDLMGGEIGLESKPGHGSTFRFTVRVSPVESMESLLPLPSTRRPAAVVEDGEARPLHVLVADDNAVNQKLASRVIEKLGHKVTVVNNGQEAVQAARGGGFDVVLMDVEMPEMDGFEATSLIRAQEHSPRRVPIVAMTAHAMLGDRDRCIQAGMDDYLSKPISTMELAALLTRLSSSQATVTAE